MRGRSSWWNIDFKKKLKNKIRICLFFCPLPFSKSHLHASWNLRGARQPEPAASLSLFHSHSLSPTLCPAFSSPSLFSPSPHSLSPPQQLDGSLPFATPPTPSSLCTSAPLWLFTRYPPVALSAFSFLFSFFFLLTPSALLANYCQFSSPFFFQLPLPLCPFSLTLPPYFHLSLLSPRPPPSGSL